MTFNAINGLSEYTTYSWRVIVSDGAGGTAQCTGNQLTYCSGTGYTCYGPFSGNVRCNRVWSVHGTQKVRCSGSMQYEYSAGSWECPVGGHGGNVFKCSSCGFEEIYCHAGDYPPCKTQNQFSGSRCTQQVDGTCSQCSGSGSVVGPVSCSHGKYTSHSYCTHGLTYQH